MEIVKDISHFLKKWTDYFAYKVQNGINLFHPFLLHSMFMNIFRLLFLVLFLSNKGVKVDYMVKRWVGVEIVLTMNASYLHRN